MLRLRAEDRFALLTTPLSMTLAISVMLSETGRPKGPPCAVEASLQFCPLRCGFRPEIKFAATWPEGKDAERTTQPQPRRGGIQ